MKTIKTLKWTSNENYHDLYLKCDISLLAMFKKFKSNSLKNDRLCPSHYLISTCLSRDAMLKMKENKR